MQEKFVTITGFKNYSGLQPFRIDRLIRCEKEPNNPYDREAIRCTLPGFGTVGYIANSTGTVAGGTMSAGRVYDKVAAKFYVRVMFTSFTKVICRVDEGEPFELKRELMAQLEDEWDDWEDDHPDDAVPELIAENT